MADWRFYCDIRSMVDPDVLPDVLSSEGTDDLTNRIAKKLGGLVPKIEDEYERGRLESLIEDFEQSDEADDADYNLQALYDWADTNLVWLDSPGTKHAPALKALGRIV